MHLEIILTQLYVRCLPIQYPGTLYLPNYTYVVYRSYALGDYTYLIIHTLYTDPMHWDIILTQLYVRCIPILCTWRLYLPNYTYVVYRSNALGHYTYPVIRTLYTDPMYWDIILTKLYVCYIPILCTWRLYLPNSTYVVYRSYALGDYIYQIIRTLYTDPMHCDIILIQLYIRCIPILCTWRLYLPNYTYVVYRSNALGHYTYPNIRTLYTDLMHLD
jgi:hypothetical protein